MDGAHQQRRGNVTDFYVLWTGKDGNDHDANLQVQATDEGIVWDVFVKGELVASGYEFAQELADRAL